MQGLASQPSSPGAWYCPHQAMASGGEMVTITGKGFTKLSPTEPATRLQYLRCKFGDEVQDDPPVSHSDKEVVCMTTWGSGYQPVSVALNGNSFESRTTEIETINLDLTYAVCFNLATMYHSALPSDPARAHDCLALTYTLHT